MILTVRTTKGEILIRLAWSSGRTVTDFVADDLRTAVDKWLAEGLDELVGRGIEAQPRHTSPTEPTFLPRLGEYLERQFPVGAEVPGTATWRASPSTT
jgi:hypothetical protein